ncbi:MAG: polysaccharide biosynthesis tyrosine autokinase [Silvibacterium sp.]
MQGWTVPPQGAKPDNAAISSSPQPSVVTPADLGKLLFKRKWVILIAVLIGIAIGIYRNITTVPEFEASSRINIDLGRSTNIGIDALIQQNEGYDEPDRELQTQVQIMRSETVAMSAIDALDLYHTKPFSEVFEQHPYNGKLDPAQRAALVGMFQGATSISVLPDTGLVDVRFQDPNPVVAMKAANAIVAAYMQRDLQSRYEGSKRISDWLAQKLTGLKAQVATNQESLADYVQKHNIVPTDTEGGNLVTDSLTAVNGQLAEAQADTIVKEARYKMAQTRNPELLMSVAPGTILGSLRAQQADLMVQVAQLRSKYGPQYPKVHELDQQLVSIQADINTEINNLTKRFAAEYNTAVQTEDLLQSHMDKLKQEAYQESGSAAQYDLLKHSAEASSELYDALEMKLEEAGITAGMNSTNVDVIDLAAVPVYPVLPKKQSNLMLGFAGGLMAGIILAFLLESLDDTLRTSEETENISHLPTLAVVPHFPLKKEASSSAQKGKPNLLPDLVSYLEPQSLGAEAFRTLRSTILLSAVDREPKVLLITSSFAEEGKSTTAANLATSFAQRQEKVLLVDTDLRRGTTHLKFGLANRAGLSTVLARESGADAYEHPLPDLPGLTVLSRGPIAPNPGEMLASHAMEDLLKQWRANYDRIILDSSPVLAVSDSLSLATQSDIVMILVRSGVTRKKALLRTREMLRRSGVHISGVVINDVDLRLENYYTYSKRYGYSYKSNYGAGYGASDGEK